MAGATWNCCSLGALSVYTIQPCTSSQCHFIRSDVRRTYACLAVTCHLHFCQNDKDVLRATVVTRGWNGYRNKSQHRKPTIEKKIHLPFCRDSNWGTTTVTRMTLENALSLWMCASGAVNTLYFVWKFSVNLHSLIHAYMMPVILYLLISSLAS